MDPSFENSPGEITKTIHLHNGVPLTMKECSPFTLSLDNGGSVSVSGNVFKGEIDRLR